MTELIAHYAPTIGLLFFFTFFVGVMIWALNPANKKTLEAYGEIPLKENLDD